MTPHSEAPPPGSDALGRAPSDQRQYISFDAGEEQYAVDIMSVREIKGWTGVTSLPNQPDFVRGVLNLRGAVIPILDLRRRLGGSFTQATERHVIVIVAVGQRLVGLLVDAVSDILAATDDRIRPVPDTGVRDDQPMLSGFLAENEQMIAMLDLNSVCNLADAERNTQN